MCIREAFLDMSLDGGQLARGLLALFAVGSFVNLSKLLHVAYTRKVENLECSGEIVFLFFGFLAAL